MPTMTRYPIGVIRTACSARNPRLRQPTPSVSAAGIACNLPAGRTNSGGASMSTSSSRASDRYSRFHSRPASTTPASSGMPTRVISSRPDPRPATKMNAAAAMARTLISTKYR
jgi:hypothetical protein